MMFEQGRIERPKRKRTISMLKNLTTLAGTAIILATLATTTVQAKQVVTEAPKTEQVVAQQVAKAQPQSPYFWLVLGVGY